MKALLLFRQRVSLSEDAFFEVVIWRVDKPVQPSPHRFKYRLAYVVDEECVVLYDNERGKGDHRHFGGMERPYAFSSPEDLMDDFMSDLERWNDENGRA